MFPPCCDALWGLTSAHQSRLVCKTALSLVEILAWIHAADPASLHHTNTHTQSKIHF